MKECRAIIWILDLFMEASGTQINNDKSNVYFFNFNLAIQNFLARTLGFQIGSFPMKYLGMILNLGPVKMVDWQEIILHVEKRIQNWAFRVLNALGRLIMLKSVLQSLPLYQLSGRACPKGICNQLVCFKKKNLW